MAGNPAAPGHPEEDSAGAQAAPDFAVRAVGAPGQGLGASLGLETPRGIPASSLSIELQEEKQA